MMKSLSQPKRSKLIGSSNDVVALQADLLEIEKWSVEGSKG